MLIPTVSGPALGALSSTWLHPDVLKLVLLGAMVPMAPVLLVLPEVVAPPEGGKTYTLRERPTGVLIPFGAGVYCGFGQAGVGFILVAALAAGLRYDLVRANALTAVSTALFSAAPFSVFILAGRVKWFQPAFLRLERRLARTSA